MDRSNFAAGEFLYGIVQQGTPVKSNSGGRLVDNLRREGELVIPPCNQDQSCETGAVCAKGPRQLDRAL